MVDLKRLRRFAIFGTLTDEQLSAWLLRFREVQYPRNEIVYRQGEPGSLFFLIESGRVALHHTETRGREKFIGYYGPGEFFGETSLFNDGNHFATVDVVIQAALIYLTKEDFLDLCREHPSVRAAIDAVTAQRIKRTVASFPSKRDEEAMVLATHRHWLWFGVRAGAWTLVLFPIMLVLAFVGGGTLAPFAALVAVAYGLGLAWFFVDWRNDWFVVSSRRVLHHEKVVLLFEKIEEAQLGKIQNVTSDVPNLPANLFDYGNVVIRTAAGGGRILFDFVPKARVIRNAIESEVQRLAEHARQDEVTQMRQIIRKELSREIGVDAGTPPTEQIASNVAVQERAGALSRMFRGFRLVPPTYERVGEQVIWRKHVLLLFRDIALPTLVFILLVPFTIYMIFGDLVGLRLPLPLALLLAVVGTAVSAFWFWYRYRDWENDLYVLKPDSLVDSERKPLWLQEKVKVAGLGQVQNVRFERDTIIENLFDFGTVVIETAGQDSGLTFDEIPHPKEAQAQISDALERYRERQRLREREIRRREFLDWFGEYHRILNTPPSATPPSA